MAIAGLRGTGTADWATDERPKNFREMILWRDPNGQTPLTALLSKMRTEATDDPEFAWYEEELNVIRLQVNQTNVATNSTQITVDQVDAQNLKAGDILQAETGENVTYDAELLLVNTTPTATTLISVTRGFGGTTATAIPDNTWLTKIGSAYAEGTGAPDAASRNPTKKYNLTQIFKDAYELTGTAEQTRFRTGDPVKNDKKRKMFDHSVNLEYSFIFGKRYETTGSNGKPLRMTGGLIWQLAQEYALGSTHCMKIWTTTPTITTFLNAVYKVFDYNAGGGAGNERIVFAGNGALNTLNKMIQSDANTQVQFQGSIKLYGMELMKFVTPQGTFYFKSHPLFNTHGLYTNSMLVIDPSAISYRPMRGRDTKPEDNIQLPGVDARKGQWRTEAGLEPHHLKTMQYHGNVV